MANNRDDFSKPTTLLMAKRVGFLCSNPNCRQLTVGSNEIESKSTSIGIGAHIAAASKGGPRYDETMTPEQRSSISNGIWLCSNCAKLIDTDVNKYSANILKTWKQNAEDETRKKLNGELKNISVGSPYLEVDLIRRCAGRSNKGYSDNNPIEILARCTSLCY